MTSLTAANAQFSLGQATLFPQPQLLQGFAADDVTDTDEVRRVEVSMGVDGILSAGFVFVPVPMRVVLQANSLSIPFFDAIDTQQQAAEDVYPLFGTLLLPGIKKKFTLNNGYLVGMKVTPHVARTLQPLTYRITWGSVVPSPQ